MIISDFSRQANILNIGEHGKTPINIIGAGATGSWIALGLAKMGFENINIYDFDEVGEHNLANQAFDISNIGQNKAEALQGHIKAHTGRTINAQNTKISGGERLSGIVMVLTDTMSSRKKIWETSIKFKPSIDLLIETRMDLRCGRIYTINPMNPKHIKGYENTLYDDAKAEVSACGVSQTVLSSALGITSQAIWKILNHLNGVHNDAETMVEFENNYIISNDWK